MPSLSSGVLEKLIEEMESDQKALYGDHQKPVLLQIRNITPVLSEGDLWPSKGFYLKVSDAKHTMYVSLPPEQDDMVLCDTLQLGQLIYVEKLEEAWPVPVLRGINPVTGRLPCVGHHEDLFSIDKFVDFKGVSDLLFVMEKSSGVEKKLRPKFRSLRASKIHPIEKITSVCRNGSGDVVEKEICEVPKGSRKVKSRCAESDSESTISSSSSSLRRRSWTGPEAADFPLVKRGVKPSARRSRSAHVSPVRSTRSTGSDDNSSCNIKRTISDDLPRKLSKKSSSRNSSVSVKHCELPLDPSMMVNLAIDSKCPESIIQWNSLPPTLVTLGKEVLRHRDVSLLAAVEALQEASVAERLLKSFSTYSELQSAEGEEHHPSIDKFFDLHDYLVHTRSIVQSLTNISPLRDDDTNIGNPSSIKEALMLAVDRKKNAMAWIKAAMTYDLSPSFSLDNVSVKATKSSNILNKNHGNVPKCTLKRKNAAHLGLVSEKENSQNWVKGSALSAVADMEKSLHDECRRWFLATFESYLDEVRSKTDLMESDSQVAETMCLIKKVGDWLDVIFSKEESDLEAYRRIKEKIYGVLLKNVERTAMAMEQMNAIFNIGN